MTHAPSAAASRRARALDRIEPTRPTPLTRRRAPRPVARRPLAERHVSERCRAAGVVHARSRGHRDAASSPRPPSSARPSPSSRSTSSYGPAPPTARCAARCGDGWTAFCCTINGGRNSCPPGSFVAGWWKADNVAVLLRRGPLHHRLQRRCPTSCRCHCTGASCDDRRTCCNQFRYGQCHQEISCYGPVVCRVATCTPPWRYDSSCTSASATDNATVTQGALLSANCGPPPPPPPTIIGSKYASLGGAGGFLGPVVTVRTGGARRPGPLRHLPRRTHLLDPVHRRPRGARRDPVDVVPVRRRLRHARIPRRHEVVGRPPQPLLQLRAGPHLPMVGRHLRDPRVDLRQARTMHGVYGPLGYPNSDVKTSSDQRSRYSNFERGRIYLREGKLTRSTGRSSSSTSRCTGCSASSAIPRAT